MSAKAANFKNHEKIQKGEAPKLAALGPEEATQTNEFGTVQHVVSASDVLIPAGAPALQRAVGNRTSTHLIQAKSIAKQNRNSIKLQRKEAKGESAGSSVQEDSGADTVLWVLDDILKYGTSRLIDGSGRHQPALEKLFQAIEGHRIGKTKEKIPGRERMQMFDEAILDLRPVLAHATDAQRAALQARRTTLLRAEADDRVEHVRGIEKIAQIPDDGHPREQAAVLHVALPQLIQTLHAANEQLERLAHHSHHVHEEVLKHLKEEGHEAEISKIGTLQGVLNLADGWLTLNDEELQRELAKNHEGPLGRAKTFTELIKVIVELTSGGVTLTATLGAAIAKATGETATAAAAMEVAGSVGSALGSVVSAVEIVHGIFVLLDSESTREQKERAVVGIAQGGAWFIGKRAGGAVVGASASLALTLGYLEAKYFANLYWQSALGINTALLREVFEFMQSSGGGIARAADKFAGASILLQEEKDPIKVKPLADIQAENQQLLTTQIDWFLQHCLPGGKDMGWGQTGGIFWPGNVTILAEVFAPLQPLRNVKSGSALALAAAQIIERIVWCLTHANEIIVASTRHKHLHDVEEDTAKKEDPHEE